MYEYKFKFSRVIDGDTVDGVIDVGFGISLKERIRLYIKTFLDKKGKYGRVLGDIKYVYARDLFNMKQGHDPWVGWKSVNTQLVQEGLALPI